MNAAIPAARAAHPFLEFRDDPINMLLPGLWCLDGYGPANPFIAGKWGEVFPGRERFGISRERLSQIRRQLMRYAARNLLAHAP